MKIIRTAQLAAAPAAPAPVAGGPTSGAPTAPVPNAPNPAAMGAGVGPNQPQDNSTASQMKRMMAMLGTLPVAQIDTPDEKEIAMMMAEQLELVAAQLKQRAAKPGPGVSSPQTQPVIATL